MKHKVEVQECKKRLLVIWLVGAAVLSVVLIGQSMSGAYIDAANVDLAGDAWGWFLPNVMPTLSLMIGVVVKDVGAVSDEKKVVDTFIYRLNLWLSVAYFLVLMSSVFLQPVFGQDVFPLEFLKKSNLWLGPMQGLVTLALGVFFGKVEQSSSATGEKK
ncbi:MAG: hypothetical protein WCK32_04385 [Chlorobiaceae bacterium]